MKVGLFHLLEHHYMKPMFPTYFLQSLYKDISVVNDFIFAIKIFSDFPLLISLGINSHSFGVREVSYTFCCSVPK